MQLPKVNQKITINTKNYYSHLWLKKHITTK